MRGAGASALSPLQALFFAGAGAGLTSLVFLQLNKSRRRRREGVDPRHHVDPAFIHGGRATLARPHWRRFEGFSRYSVPGAGYVWRLVLTGGPCGGRSSAIKHLSEELKRRGVDVYAVPEAPTTLINGGCRPPAVFGDDDDDAAYAPAAGFGGDGPLDMGPAPVVPSPPVVPGGDDAAGGPRYPRRPRPLDQVAAFETGLLQLQLQMERSFVKIAQATGRPAVVVMDRGLLDVAAYLPQDGAQWREILGDLDLDEHYLLGRYDMVLHLRTAAAGAEAHFDEDKVSSLSSEGRGSALHRALDLDGRLERAWRRHPRRIIVDNAHLKDFDHKLSEVLGHVSNLVQPPGPAGIL